MPPIFVTLFRALVILTMQLVGFFLFYNHPHGRHAVYHTWYAWVIDTLAILSGSTIMVASVFAMHNTQIFTITIPAWILWSIFVIGSWQAAIHAVKLVIRIRRSK